jgi:Domain of Unknown Function with PDB structure (DUF3857)/Transglutaminase-like superfamily
VRSGNVLRLSWLALCGVLWGPLAVAGKPTWLEEQLHAPLPVTDDRTDAVVLLSDAVLTVERNGTLLRTTHRVVKILRPAGAAWSVWGAAFGPTSPIRRLHAWSIGRDGRTQEAGDREVIESEPPVGMTGILMSDVHMKVLRAPGAVPGSIVAFELEQVVQPVDLTDSWFFQETVPVRETQYTLEMPSGWRYVATWERHDEVAPRPVGPTSYRWAIQDLKPIRVEAQMPSPWGVVGRMQITLIGPRTEQRGLQSWAELGTWYAHLAQGRRESSTEIAQKVRQLTAAEATPLDKIRAVAKFVQDNVRYVAILLGQGGYQPHAAGEVFTHGYGDCKDKATLLSAMLKELGIDSYYVVVNSQRDAVNGTSPVTVALFNHMILAVPLPPDLTDPSLVATYSHPTLGRLLIFDPTDPYTPFGRIRGALEGNWAVLIQPAGGELIQLPQLKSELSGLTRTAHFSMDVSGALTGDVDEIRSGELAAQQRAAFAATTQESDQIKPVERMLRDSVGDFEILKASFDGRRDITAPLEWRYSIKVEHYASASGDLLLVRPRVIGSKSSALLEAREPRANDIEIPSPQHDIDRIDIALPPGIEPDELPSAVDLERSFGSYHSKTELVGHTLRYTRTFELKQLRIAVAQADELKAFYRSIAEDERAQAVLKRATPSK